MKTEYHVVTIPVKITPDIVDDLGEPPEWTAERPGDLVFWRLRCALKPYHEQCGFEVLDQFESVEVDENFYNIMDSDQWEEKLDALAMHRLLGLMKDIAEECAYPAEDMAAINRVIEISNKMYGGLPDNVKLPGDA